MVGECEVKGDGQQVRLLPHPGAMRQLSCIVKFRTSIDISSTRAIKSMTIRFADSPDTEGVSEDAAPHDGDGYDSPLENDTVAQTPPTTRKLRLLAQRKLRDRNGCFAKKLAVYQKAVADEKAADDEKPANDQKPADDEKPTTSENDHDDAKFDDEKPVLEQCGSAGPSGSASIILAQPGPGTAELAQPRRRWSLQGSTQPECVASPEHTASPDFAGASTAPMTNTNVPVLDVIEQGVANDTVLCAIGRSVRWRSANRLRRIAGGC